MQQQHEVISRSNGGNAFGDLILLFSQDIMIAKPYHHAHFVHMLAGGVHDNLALNLTLGRLHGPVVVFVLCQPSHPKVLVDFGLG